MHMRNCLLLVAACAASPLAAQQADTASTIDAPALAGPVTTDGTLGDAEWRDAWRQSLASGATLRMGYNDQGMAIGIESEGLGVLSIFLEVDGKILVVHASAQLGTAVYERAENSWNPTTHFAYEPPSPDFWKREGWRCSVVQPGGAGDMECLISWRRLGLGESADDGGKDTVRIRVTHASFADGDVPAWPPKADDDTTNRALLMGQTPERLAFDSRQWGHVRFSKAAKP